MTSPRRKKILLTGGHHDGRMFDVTEPFYKRINCAALLSDGSIVTEVYEACWLTDDCDVYAYLRTE
jgi:hypothetical protein